MAIVRDYEGKARDAFIAVLQAYTDLTAVVPSGQIRKWSDASVSAAESAYVLVHAAVGHTDPGVGPRSTLAQVIVNIRAMTYKESDQNGDTVKSAIAAIHDKLAAGTLLADLIAATTLTTFYEVLIDDQDHDDTGPWRWRQLTLDVRLKITPP